MNGRNEGGSASVHFVDPAVLNKFRSGLGQVH
jgi:hypothetical protein